MAGYPTVFNNQGATSGYSLSNPPAWLKGQTLNPNGSVGTTQTSSSGLFSGPGAPKTSSPSFSQGLMNQAVAAPQIPAHQTPTTPVKSITTPDGSTSTYHAPTTQDTIPTSPTNTGLISGAESQSQIAQGAANVRTPEQIAQATGQNIQTNSGNQNTTGYSSTNPATYPGLINQLANTSSQPIQSYQDIQKQIAQNLEQQKELQTNYAEANKNLDTSGIDASLATGQENVLARTLAAKEGYLAQQGAGLSTQLGQANTQQGLQQSGLTSAAGLTQPVGQFGVLTNPQTGQPINGLSATQAAQQGGYIQGLQSGAQAQGAVSGTTNAANAAQTGTQAFGVNLALQQMSSLKPLISNFLSQTGINPSDAQIYNAPISTYLSKIEASGQITQWNTLMSELNRYSSQLIGTGALTPTGVTQATQLQDPSNLSLSQIDGVLQTLSDAGNNQLYNLQQQTNQAVPGNSINTGTSVNPVTSTKPAPVASPGTPGGGKATPAQEFARGTILNIGHWALGAVQNLAGEALGWIAKGIAG